MNGDRRNASPLARVVGSTRPLRGWLRRVFRAAPAPPAGLGDLDEALESVKRHRAHLAASDVQRVLDAIRGTALWRELDELKRSTSMLHTDVLVMLYAFASVVEGGILEFGPYVGGSTIAIAKGLRRSRRQVPFVTVEVGGRHDHNMIPSLDILADLRRNLAAHGVSDLSRIVVGFSNEPHVLAEIERTFGPAGLGLWMIDTDGQVGRDFRNCLRYCRPGCIVVIDDYVSDWVPEKTSPTRAAVHEAVAAGRTRPIGVYGWGTWIGQVC